MPFFKFVIIDFRFSNWLFIQLDFVVVVILCDCHQCDYVFVWIFVWIICSDFDWLFVVFKFTHGLKWKPTFDNSDNLDKIIWMLLQFVFCLLAWFSIAVLGSLMVDTGLLFSVFILFSDGWFLAGLCILLSVYMLVLFSYFCLLSAFCYLLICLAPLVCCFLFMLCKNVYVGGLQLRVCVKLFGLCGSCKTGW